VCVVLNGSRCFGDALLYRGKEIFRRQMPFVLNEVKHPLGIRQQVVGGLAIVQCRYGRSYFERLHAQRNHRHCCCCCCCRCCCCCECCISVSVGVHRRERAVGVGVWRLSYFRSLFLPSHPSSKRNRNEHTQFSRGWGCVYWSCDESHALWIPNSDTKGSPDLSLVDII
jgi:hypothetical protein